MEDTNNKVIPLLGMKNGGLELLKNSLISSNVYFGKDDGNRESEFLKELSEKILLESGGSWHNPPHKIKVNHYQRQLRDLFVSYFDDREWWGFENPNTVLLMNIWESSLKNVHPIGIFRHPNQMVTIYKSKYNFSAKITYELWLKYNKKLLAKYEESPFPIIELGNKKARYNKAIVKAFEQIGLELKPKNLQLSQGSRAQLERREMTKEVGRLYRRLLKVKVQL